MTEEIKETKDQCNCIVHCECVRKFIIVALGSFVGVFCALSLFACLHKPPMGPCPLKNPPGVEHQQQNKDFHGDFDKKPPVKDRD